MQFNSTEQANQEIDKLQKIEWNTDDPKMKNEFLEASKKNIDDMQKSINDNKDLSNERKLLCFWNLYDFLLKWINDSSDIKDTDNLSWEEKIIAERTFAELQHDFNVQLSQIEARIVTMKHIKEWYDIIRPHLKEPRNIWEHVWEINWIEIDLKINWNDDDPQKKSLYENKNDIPRRLGEFFKLLWPEYIDTLSLIKRIYVTDLEEGTGAEVSLEHFTLSIDYKMLFNKTDLKIWILTHEIAHIKHLLVLASENRRKDGTSFNDRLNAIQWDDLPKTVYYQTDPNDSSSKVIVWEDEKILHEDKLSQGVNLDDNPFSIADNSNNNWWKNDLISFLRQSSINPRDWFFKPYWLTLMDDSDSVEWLKKIWIESDKPIRIEEVTTFIEVYYWFKNEFMRIYNEKEWDKPKYPKIRRKVELFQEYGFLPKVL